MAWVTFASIQEFEVWHKAKKEELGLPRKSVDIGGNILENATITNEYTIPYIVSENDIRAIVNDKDIDGLILSSEPEYLKVSNYSTK